MNYRSRLLLEPVLLALALLEQPGALSPPG
jgi:hypothetical protein